MKRFVIFAVLGPPLGWAVLICRDRMLAADMPIGTVSDAVWIYVRYMPLAYVFGMLPALATAGVDLKLSARFEGCKRLLGTTVFGFLVTYVFWLLAVPLKLSATQFLSFGIIGMLPAAVCSWLSGKPNGGTLEDLRT